MKDVNWGWGWGWGEGTELIQIGQALECADVITRNRPRSYLVPSLQQTRQIPLIPREENSSDPDVHIPRKAEGETVPLLLETMTLIPVSTKGTEKSTTSERSSLMVREPTAMTARW